MSRSSTTSSKPSANHESLVDHDEAIVQGPLRRLVAIFVLGLFLAATAGTGVIDWFFGTAESGVVGAEAHREERQDAEAQIHDGTLARRAESQLRQRSQVRRWVLPPFARFMMSVFDEGSQSIVVGKNEWLFLADRVYVSEGYRERIQDAARNIARLNARLQQKGTTLVVLPVPRKGVVRRDFLPASWDPNSNIEPTFVRALTERGIKAVDLLPIFRRDSDPIFFMADSHWNDHARVLAAEAACRTMENWRPVKERPNRLDVESRMKGPGDLLRFLGAGDAESPDSYDRIRPFDERDRRLRKAPNPKEMPGIAITGTSFTHGSWISEYLYHFSGIRVHRAPMPAVGAVVPLREFLRARSDDWPQHLIWEIPIFEVIHPDWSLAGLEEAIDAIQ